MLFFLGERPRHIDLLARSRIESRVIHASRDGHRRRGEDLDALDRLLPFPFEALDLLRQLFRLFRPAPRMGDHKVIFEMLFPPFIDLMEQAAEFLERGEVLVHPAQHLGRDMLGRDLEQPGQMMPAQLL